MTVLRETGYAKINLALHVRRRCADGYHALETLFAFAQDGDLLEAAPAEGLSLTIEGPFGGELRNETREDNLVLRAALALRVACGVGRGARLRLDKRLPVASGIGGGSADAAAALRLLCRLWSVTPGEETLHRIAASLGADVPACLASVTARGEGRGDALQPIDVAQLADMPLLLVNPSVPLSTASVFRDWDGQDRGPLLAGDPLAAAREGRNDLEPAALALQPAIAEVLALLRQQAGATLVRMSGSGATCFALFDTAEECAAAAARIGRAKPGWWRLKTRLR